MFRSQLILVCLIIFLNQVQAQLPLNLWAPPGSTSVTCETLPDDVGNIAMTAASPPISPLDFFDLADFEVENLPSLQLQITAIRSIDSDGYECPFKLLVKSGYQELGVTSYPCSSMDILLSNDDPGPVRFMVQNLDPSRPCLIQFALDTATTQATVEPQYLSWTNLQTSFFESADSCSNDDFWEPQSVAISSPVAPTNGFVTLARITLSQETVIENFRLLVVGKTDSNEPCSFSVEFQSSVTPEGSLFANGCLEKWWTPTPDSQELTIKAFNQDPQNYCYFKSTIRSLRIINNQVMNMPSYINLQPLVFTNDQYKQGMEKLWIFDYSSRYEVVGVFINSTFVKFQIGNDSLQLFNTSNVQNAAPKASFQSLGSTPQKFRVDFPINSVTKILVLRFRGNSVKQDQRFNLTVSPILTLAKNSNYTIPYKKRMGLEGSGLYGSGANYQESFEVTFVKPKSISGMRWKWETFGCPTDFCPEDISKVAFQINHYSLDENDAVILRSEKLGAIPVSLMSPMISLQGSQTNDRLILDYQSSDTSELFDNIKGFQMKFSFCCCCGIQLNQPTPILYDVTLTPGETTVTCSNIIKNSGVAPNSGVTEKSDEQNSYFTLASLYLPVNLASLDITIGAYDDSGNPCAFQLFWNDDYTSNVFTENVCTTTTLSFTFATSRWHIDAQIPNADRSCQIGYSLSNFVTVENVLEPSESGYVYYPVPLFLQQMANDIQCSELRDQTANYFVTKMMRPQGEKVLFRNEFFEEGFFRSVKIIVNGFNQEGNPCSFNIHARAGYESITAGNNKNKLYSSSYLGLTGCAVVHFEVPSNSTETFAQATLVNAEKSSFCQFEFAIFNLKTDNSIRLRNFWMDQTQNSFLIEMNSDDRVRNQQWTWIFNFSSRYEVEEVEFSATIQNFNFQFESLEVGVFTMNGFNPTNQLNYGDVSVHFNEDQGSNVQQRVVAIRYRNWGWSDSLDFQVDVEIETTKELTTVFEIPSSSKMYGLRPGSFHKQSYEVFLMKSEYVNDMNWRWESNVGCPVDSCPNDLNQINITVNHIAVDTFDMLDFYVADEKVESWTGIQNNVWASADGDQLRNSFLLQFTSDSVKSGDAIELDGFRVSIDICCCCSPPAKIPMLSLSEGLMTVYPLSCSSLEYSAGSNGYTQVTQFLNPGDSGQVASLQLVSTLIKSVDFTIYGRDQNNNDCSFSLSFNTSLISGTYSGSGCVGPATFTLPILSQTVDFFLTNSETERQCEYYYSLSQLKQYVPLKTPTGIMNELRYFYSDWPTCQNPGNAEIGSSVAVSPDQQILLIETHVDLQNIISLIVLMRAVDENGNLCPFTSLAKSGASEHQSATSTSCYAMEFTRSTFVSNEIFQVYAKNLDANRFCSFEYTVAAKIAPVVESVSSSTGFSTDGENWIVIHGRNFGYSTNNCEATDLTCTPYTYQVTIGGSNCAQVTVLSDVSLKCISPPGIGSNIPISISINGIHSQPANIFAYDRPILETVSPSAITQTTRDGIIIITAKNLGSSANAITVYLTAYSDPSNVQICPQATWGSSKYLSCTIPAGFQLGTYRVSIEVSGQESEETNILFRYGSGSLPPEVADQQVTTDQNNDVMISLYSFDPDDAISGATTPTSFLELFKLPENGQLYQYAATGRGARIAALPFTVAAYIGKIIYVPNENFYGNDSFQYLAKDSSDVLSQVATVGVFVKFVNQPPTPNPSSLVLTTNGDVSISTNLVVKDPDDSEFIFRITKLPTKGSLHDVDRGVAITRVPYVANNQRKSVLKVEFQPVIYEFGTNYASFEWDATDSVGQNFTSAGVVTINVNQVNHAPYSFNQSVQTPENIGIRIKLTGGDHDPGSTLSYQIYLLPTKGGTLYQHNDLTGTKASAIQAVNQDVTSSESWIYYEPGLNYFGPEIFYYRVRDERGAYSAPGKIDIFVTFVNQPPVASPKSVITAGDTNIDIVLKASDPDDSVMEYFITSLPARGYLYFGAQKIISVPFSLGTNLQQAAVLFKPKIYESGTPYTTFTWNCRDSGGNTLTSDATVTVSVTFVNHAPIPENLFYQTSENTEVVITLSVTEYDPSQTQRMTIKSLPTKGALFQYNAATNQKGSALQFVGQQISDSTHRVVYVPNNYENGLDSFSFDSTDNLSATSSTDGVVTINIASVNQPPYVGSLFTTVTTVGDQSVEITLQASDHDDESTFGYYISQLPTRGVLLFENQPIEQVPFMLQKPSQKALVTFLPVLYESGSGYASFKWNCRDNASVAMDYDVTVTIDVAFVNHPPFVKNVWENTEENKEIIIEFDVTDVDVKYVSTNLLVTIASLPSLGQLYQTLPSGQRSSQKILIADQKIQTGVTRITYVPDPNVNGIDSFNYSVSDGTASSSPATAFISIGAVNQAPEIPNSDIEITFDGIVNENGPIPVELSVSDVDESIGFALQFVKAPNRGTWYRDEAMTIPIQFLNSTAIIEVPKSAGPMSTITLFMKPDGTGGGVPYSYFEYKFIDKNMTANKETTSVSVMVECSITLPNNIWSLGPPCKKCPTGAVCSDIGEYYPTNLAGFFPIGEFTFVPCVPDYACPVSKPVKYFSSGLTQASNSTFQCAPGYSADRCGLCQRGYYKKGDMCEVCPSYNFNPFLIAFILIVVVVFVMYFANVLRKIDIGFLGILISYWQIISIFNTFNLRWPSSVSNMYHYFSFLYFNIELTSPECFVVTDTSATYELKWYGTMVQPILIVVIIFFLIGLNLLYLLISFWIKKQWIKFSTTKYGEWVSTKCSKVLSIFKNNKKLAEKYNLPPIQNTMDSGYQAVDHIYTTKPPMTNAFTPESNTGASSYTTTGILSKQNPVCNREGGNCEMPIRSEPLLEDPMSDILPQISKSAAISPANNQITEVKKHLDNENNANMPKNGSKRPPDTNHEHVKKYPAPSKDKKLSNDTPKNIQMNTNPSMVSFGQLFSDEEAGEGSQELGLTVLPVENTDAKPKLNEPSKNGDLTRFKDLKNAQMKTKKSSVVSFGQLFGDEQADEANQELSLVNAVVESKSKEISKETSDSYSKQKNTPINARSSMISFGQLFNDEPHESEGDNKAAESKPGSLASFAQIFNNTNEETHLRPKPDLTNDRSLGHKSNQIMSSVVSFGQLFNEQQAETSEGHREAAEIREPPTLLKAQSSLVSFGHIFEGIEKLGPEKDDSRDPPVTKKTISNISSIAFDLADDDSIYSVKQDEDKLAILKTNGLSNQENNDQHVQFKEFKNAEKVTLLPETPVGLMKRKQSSVSARPRIFLSQPLLNDERKEKEHNSLWDLVNKRNFDNTNALSVFSMISGSFENLENQEELGGGKVSLAVTLFGIFLLLLKMVYISVAQRSLEIFDCTYNAVTDKFYYDSETSRLCYDSWWYKILPFSLLGLIFYVIGIPFLFLALFYRRRQYLKIPLKKRTTWQQFIVEVTYKKKSEFTPETEYWDVVLLMRKLFIVGCQLFFTKFIAFQSLAVIMVFIVFLTAHVKVNPFAIKSVNNLETGVLMSSALVLMCGIMFYVQEFKTQSEMEILGYGVIVIVVLTSSLIVYFLVRHLRFLYGNYQRQKAKEAKKAAKEELIKKKVITQGT